METLVRIFSFSEYVTIVRNAARSFVLLRKAKKEKRMTKQLKERIMLATTKVNGCHLCSFVHTKIALSSGMGESEIKHILAGQYDDVPNGELIAVLFAEHYAESHEQPSEESIQRLIETYGLDKCNCIQAVCSMITMTNAMGITMEFLFDRLKFRRHKGSYFLNELAILLFTFVGFPILVIGNAIKINILRMH